MLLSARMLKDVQGVNSFEPDSQLSWTEGDALSIYLQLIDASLDLDRQGFKPAGRRFVPASGSTLTVTLENIDDGKVVTRLAVQPFAQDGSIWQLQILATDECRGTPQMRLVLDQGLAGVTRGLVKQSLKIEPNTNLTSFP